METTTTLINKTIILKLISQVLLLLLLLNNNYATNIKLDSYNNLIAPSEQYDNILILIEPNIYVLYWSIDNTELLCEAHVRSPGWFGFGLSRSASIENSDLVIAWLNDDGTLGHFSDRHTTDSLEAKIDLNQNWKPIFVNKINDVKIFKFSRKLFTCDYKDDIDIDLSNKSGIYFIYLIGELVKNDIFLHGTNQGSIFINLTSYNLNSIKNCETSFVNGKSEEFNPKASDFYQNYIDLVDNKFRLYWNATESLFIGEAHVKTKGWFSLGFSPKGKMEDSDVFIAWFKNGIPHLKASFKSKFLKRNNNNNNNLKDSLINFKYSKDCYIYGKRVIIDLYNNINILYANETQDFTIFKFKRDIILCDPDDIIIESSNPFLVYSWSEHGPNHENEFLNYSLNFGSTQINLYKNSFSNTNHILYQDLEIFDLNLSYIIFNSDKFDFNYCKLYEIKKNFNIKRHIIKWEIIVSNLNKENVQSINFYECNKDYVPRKTDEFNCDLDINLSYCSLSAISWSHGADFEISFPDDTGYPFGGDTDYEYLILKIGYHNYKDKTAFIDNLSIKFYMTENLRQNELGSLILGTEQDPLSILIPPGLEHFPINTYCYNSCFKSKIDNITFVMASPYTKSSGIDIWTKVLKNDSESFYLQRNKLFNPNKKNFYKIYPRVTINKYDNLITRCTYSTKDRNFLTMGGDGFEQESCIYFYFYYPRVNNFKNCRSFPSFEDQLNALKQLKSDGYINFESTLNSSIDTKLSNLYEAYKSLENVKNFDDILNRKIYALYSTSRYYAYCDGSFNFQTHEKLIVKNNYHHNQEICSLLYDKDKNQVKHGKLFNSSTNKSNNIYVKHNILYYLLFILICICCW